MKLSDLITEVRQWLRSLIEGLGGISLKTLSMRRLTRGLSFKSIGIRRSTVLATLGLAVLAIACTGQGATD